MYAKIREGFAEFVVGTRYENLPEEVICQTKQCVLDFLGVALAGSKVGLAPVITDMICAMGGEKEATVIGDGRRIPALKAALINGIAGHTLDMDDGHRYAGAHPGVVVIPAALALGERENSTGKDLIEATVVGYETFIRIASGINPLHAQKGFHTTGTVGPFGAAAACAKLLGLDEKGVENALSIAGLQGAGLLEVTNSGQMMKPLHAGRAVEAGVLATLLAGKGAQGPDSIFEGEKGFFQAFSDVSEPRRVIRGLGRDFEIMNTYFKLHATCRGTHASVDAVMEICKNYDIGPEDIKDIEIETFPHALKLCGHIVHPENILGAKFSIPYAVAMAVTLGDLAVDRFTEENIHDEHIKNLAGKVKACVGEEWAKCYPHKRGASARITTYSGQSYSFALPLAKGSPENPAGLEDLKEKFHANASHAIVSAQATKLADQILNLENLLVRDIVELLC